MEDETKKKVMIGVIIACIACAVIVHLAFRKEETGIGTIDPEKTTWVKCMNPQCGVDYEMQLRKFHEEAEKASDPTSLATPPLECKECGEQSIKKAVKCEKCGLVFLVGAASVSADFSDRCPNKDCGYSKQENDRKKRAAETNR